jgi:type II secretory pathway pseudopilin PulG
MVNRMRNGDSVLQSKKLLRKVRTAGFTYVLLLVLIAVIALLASSSIRFGAQMSRRDAEQSLLFVGSEFSSALRSYAAFANSPASSTLPAVRCQQLLPCGGREHLKSYSKTIAALFLSVTCVKFMPTP